MKKKAIYLLVLISLTALSCAPSSEGDDQPSFTNNCVNDPVGAAVAFQTDANLNKSNGTITIKAVGGNAPYRFAIGAGSFQTSSKFVGLKAAEYTIRVTDNNGCTSQLMVRIVESVGNAPSFITQVQPIVNAYCATSSCHVSGNAVPAPLNSYQAVSAYALHIKPLIENKTMPPSGSDELSEEDIATLIAWIDAGAPNN